MKTTAELFGENLRNQLIVKNKSQADIARYLKVTEASVSRWVNGQSMPRAKMLDRICLFLNCSVEDLTTDHSKPVGKMCMRCWMKNTAEHSGET